MDWYLWQVFCLAKKTFAKTTLVTLFIKWVIDPKWYVLVYKLGYYSNCWASKWIFLAQTTLSLYFTALESNATIWKEVSKKVDLCSLCVWAGGGRSVGTLYDLHRIIEIASKNLVASNVISEDANVEFAVNHPSGATFEDARQV